MAGELWVPRASAVGVAVAVCVALGLGACHRSAPGPRERVLAGLPAGAVAVVAADGRARSEPRIRGALDAALARRPASLTCVVDAAVASDAIAASVDRAGNTALLIALPLSRPPRCAALSQRAPGLWIATLGAGPPAQAASVLDDPRFARARPYLLGAPVAAAVLGEVHVVAAAQPEPLDAWVAIDVPGSAEAIAQAIAARIAQLARAPGTAELAGKLRVERPDASQLVVRLTGALPASGAARPGGSAAGPAGGEFAAAVRAALAWADERDDGAPAGPAFACPAHAPEITCTGGTRYRVASLATGLVPILATGRPAPVVVNGSIAGLRLDAAVPGLGLLAGDVIVAMAGRLVTSRTMLADRIAHARAATTVTVRRGTEEAVLEFAER
jgi:membrane-associated protease RseP (regulator of RpoE activity)